MDECPKKSPSGQGGRIVTDKKSSIVSFIGASGSGKTTLLLNAASNLKEKFEDLKICIIDFDLFYPSVLFKLHQLDIKESKYNIFDLLDDVDVIGEREIRNAMIKYKALNLDILNTPHDNLKNIENIKVENISKLIERLSEMYDYIFIDTTSNIREDEVLVSLNLSDKIILVTEQDITNVLHNRKNINMLELIENYKNEFSITNKINVVINKYKEKNGLSEDIISESLYSKSIITKINESTNATYYHNNGLLLYKNDYEVKYQIRKLSQFIHPHTIENENLINKKISKEKWIELNGSEHLKDSNHLGYNSQRLYVAERWQKEFPHFTLDFDNESKWKYRSSPSEKALKIEKELREIYDDYYDIRVVWLTKPSYKIDNNWKEKEAIVIKNYLNKYVLVKEIN